MLNVDDWTALSHSDGYSMRDGGHRYVISKAIHDVKGPYYKIIVAKEPILELKIYRILQYGFVNTNTISLFKIFNDHELYIACEFIYQKLTDHYNDLINTPTAGSDHPSVD